ncbi:glycoside hydrolase N-terminal domain-containing protein, partial [Mariniphaga sediminis]|uniref:glycoside hydrolase N-terminal domain-containing protein n=1 Tax=Mariniphaga sediminis TaxID=1628158 RepID=UPI003569F752
MKLSGKEDRNTKYTRRSFIKKAGSGIPILFSPQYVAYNLLESRNNEELLYSYGLSDIDPSLNWIGGSNNTLLYAHPADVKSYPLHAMPVGNGSMGAMFEGHPKHERIIINHCRLRPAFYTETERDVSNYLPLVRKLFLERNYKATQATFDKMQSENGGKRNLNNYHQVCDLILEMDQITTVTEYKRLLDLQCGVGKASFNNEGTNYIKTYFTSFPDDLFVVNLAASKPESISCTISLGRIPYKSCWLDASVKGNSMILNGKYAEGTCFEVSVTLINQGGI